MMNRSLKQITFRALFILAALAAGSLAVGCEAQVIDGEEGGGGGESGGGDSAACPTLGDVKQCTEAGFTAQCVEIDGELRWSECFNQFGMSTSSSTSSAFSTPLVLSFDGAPVQMTVDAVHGFTLNATSSVTTDWPTAKTPWLALDIDGSGAIEDGSELFGSMTALKSGSRAVNGFVALRELDANGDGKITAADPGFVKLLIWSDRDGDRRSSQEEIAKAASSELLSIDLDYVSDARCDERGNCEIERASFRYRDASGIERTGAVIDVHLRAQP
jgi:hypothetical protein